MKTFFFVINPIIGIITFMIVILCSIFWAKEIAKMAADLGLEKNKEIDKLGFAFGLIGNVIKCFIPILNIIILCYYIFGYKILKEKTIDMILEGDSFI